MPALQAGGLRRCRGATDMAILKDRCTGQLNQGKGIGFVTRKGHCKPPSKVTYDLQLMTYNLQQASSQPRQSPGAFRQNFLILGEA